MFQLIDEDAEGRAIGPLGAAATEVLKRKRSNAYKNNMIDILNKWCRLIERKRLIRLLTK